MPLTDIQRKNGANLKRLKSDKQRRFALEYMLDHNPKEAAIRAGYKRNSATQTAHKLLKNPIISAYISKAEREDVERLNLDRDEVLRQLYYALTRNDGDFRNEDGSLIPPGDLSDRAKAVIDGYDVDEFFDGETGELTKRKTKIRVTPKLGGIEMAMKHKGLFEPDRVSLEAPLLERFFAGLSAPPILDPIEARLAEEQARLENLEEDG